MDQKTCATLLLTAILLHSYVHLSTAASARNLLEVEEEMMVVARRLTGENIKDYAPVQANPRHDPDLNPSTDPHDLPPPRAEPPRQTAPPIEIDPADPFGRYHHVHHQQHPSATQTQTPPIIPAPAPITTTINDMVGDQP